MTVRHPSLSFLLHICAVKDQLLQLLDARVGFSPTAYSADEGGTVTIIVQLFDTIATQVSVEFSTVDGTAVSTLAGDYTGDQQTLTFVPGGNTIQFISVQTLTDARAELTETFTAQLSQPSAGLSITQPTATVQIFDTTGTYLM